MLGTLIDKDVLIFRIYQQALVLRTDKYLEQHWVKTLTSNPSG